MSNPKIFIGLPAMELSRYSKFWRTKDGLDFTGLDVRVPEQVWSQYIDNNQNTLIRWFLKTDAEYFWLLNDDMVMYPQTLRQLVSHQKDIVVPLLVEHDHPHSPLFYDYREGFDYYPRCLEPGDKGLVKGIGSGGAGMLIHRRVLETLKDPWFDTHTVISSKGDRRTQGESLPIRTTEDLYFCRNAIEAGFDIWCDLDCTVGHITLMTLWPVRLEDGRWGTSFERNGAHTVVPAAKSARPTEEHLTVAISQ